MSATGWRYKVMASGAVGLLATVVAVPTFAAHREGAGVSRSSAALPASRMAAGGLSSAALQPSDLPAGFSKPRTKVVTRYTPHPIKLASDKGGYTCGVVPDPSGATWREGLMSESKKTPDAIYECAFAWATTAQAHADFLRDVSLVRKVTKSIKGYKQVALPTIGDESAAWGLGRPGARTYLFFILEFRKGSTVVSVTYAGVFDLLSAGTFSHIGSAIAARVAAGTSTSSGVPPAPAASVKLPAATLGACSQERSLHSLNSTMATWLRFKNLGSKTVAIYWLDYSGHRELYQDLKPNTIWLEQTYATHSWVVASVPNNRCEEIVVASSKATEADIH